MDFTTIDLSKWNRGKLFQFYIDKMRIVMSLTVDIDVTNMKIFSKEKNIINIHPRNFQNFIRGCYSNKLPFVCSSHNKF